MSIRPFAEASNFTQMHNYVLDVIMPALPPNAWKILCLIIRKTKGWHKPCDQISYTQIQIGTGIAHPDTVHKALGVLLAKGYILKTVKGKWEATVYRLNTDYEVSATSINEVTPASKNEVALTSKNEVTKETREKTHQKKVESAQRALSTRARAGAPERKLLTFELTPERVAWAERNTPEIVHSLDLEVRKMLDWCERHRSRVSRVTDKRFHAWLFKAVEFTKRDARVVQFERPKSQWEKNQEVLDRILRETEAEEAVVNG